MGSDGGAASSKTETEDDGINVTGIAVAIGAVAGAALLARIIGSALFSSSGSDLGKTMKAPGRDLNFSIFRAHLEGDPKSYFEDLRKWKAGMFRG